MILVQITFDYNLSGLLVQAEDSIGRIVEILEEDKRNGDDCHSMYMTARKFYTGGQHAVLRMPTIHASSEESYILFQVKVSSTQYIHSCTDTLFNRTLNTY